MTGPILDQVVLLFSQTTPQVLGRIAPLLVPLYVLFFTVQFGWDLVRWTLAGTPDALARGAKKLLVFLLTYGLLVVLPWWLPPILSGWEHLGQIATGLSGLSPDGIWTQGLSLGFSLFDSWSEKASLLLLPMGQIRAWAMVVIWASFGAVAVRLAQVLIEGTIVLGGLVIFLPFAGLSATFGVAEGYLRYVFDVGIRAYVLFLIVGVGQDLGATWDTAVRLSSPAGSLWDHLSILLSSVLFALLAWSLPRTVSRWVAGGVSFSGLNPMGRGG